MRILIMLGLLLMAQTGNTLTFKAEVEDTEWRLSPSIFACEFVQPIPNYGEAVFFHEAGEDLLFHLKTQKNLMGSGLAALHIEPPIWRPSNFAKDLGYVEVVQKTKPVLVDHGRSNQMMQALIKGLQPTFTRKARYDEAEPIRIAVSPANFNSFYKDYLGCVAGLLPVNFRQVAKSKVLFKGGGNYLTPQAKKKLDLIILYVKADPAVTALYIDGHSDSSGRRYNNRRLSEERAVKVTDYMIKKGLNPEMFTTRYHGERYPVASNKTRTGRQLNRRVTIRLEKEDEEMEMDF